MPVLRGRPKPNLYSQMKRLEKQSPPNPDPANLSDTLFSPEEGLKLFLKTLETIGRKRPRTASKGASSGSEANLSPEERLQLSNLWKKLQTQLKFLALTTRPEDFEIISVPVTAEAYIQKNFGFFLVYIVAAASLERNLLEDVLIWITRTTRGISEGKIELPS